VKPETASEKPAPEIKAEADTSISVGKTDGENAFPASKVVSLLLYFNKKYSCYKSRPQKSSSYKHSNLSLYNIIPNVKMER